jgi:putative phosphonate metabolism protein
MRFALYAAPSPGGALHEAGSRWLGRDAASGLTLEQPPVPGVESGQLAIMTAEPRRYGFHGTLKPPFALKAELTQAALEAAVETLAARLASVVIPDLKVARIGHFLALVPGEPDEAVNALAAECVEALDGLRAPMPVEELARRRAGCLSPRQDEMLLRWGYPYVMDQFRYHMTLSGRISPAEMDLLEPAARDWFGPSISGGFTVDALALFMEPERGAPLVMIRRYALGRAA